MGIDAVIEQAAGSKPRHVRGAEGRSRATGYVAIVALAAVLWVLRLSGSIDLRYDAAVYYVLGTSIAEGRGYRLLNEPGTPEAVQYPPLLPAIVAGAQKLAGTSDPAVVGPWLRRAYAVLFVGFAVAVLALAGIYLSPPLALLAAALCVGHANVFLVSDLLFTELPFVTAVVGLGLVLRGRRFGEKPIAREGAAFLLASAAFLLRAAGIAALAAWVGEAWLRRQWRLGAIRAALALVPFGAWQAHVARVKASDEYRQPAYAYQRASYQFYNATYGDNMALFDPFRPEHGRATARDWLGRVAANLVAMPFALGESVSGNMGFWRALVRGGPEERAPEREWENRLARFPLLVLCGFVVGGLAILARRGEWLLVLFAAGSVALVCTTPWPEQFARYLTPLVPFLTIAFVLGLAQAFRCLARHPRASARRLRWAVVALAGIVVALQVNGVKLLFKERHFEPATRVADGSPFAPRLFFYGRSWVEWEKAVRWIDEQAERDDVVATTSPHLCHLWTGLKAVMPPMEADAAEARRLLDDVPVRWVVVDALRFLDIARHYAQPALEAEPAQWRLVKRFGGAAVYRRVDEREGGGES